MYILWYNSRISRINAAKLYSIGSPFRHYSSIRCMFIVFRRLWTQDRKFQSLENGRAASVKTFNLSADRMGRKGLDPQLMFMHIHHLFRILYTLASLGTVNIYWWWCINLCRVLRFGTRASDFGVADWNCGDRLRYPPRLRSKYIWNELIII